MKKEIIRKLVTLSENSYDKIAAEFDATRKKYLWPEMTIFGEEVKDGDRVLDAGCGNGRLLEVFKDKKINYLGVDGSRALLELAKKNYPGYRFLELDLSGTSKSGLEKINDEKFDFIFCLAVLQHIPSNELRIEVLQNLKSLLAPNGKMVISNWNLFATRHRHLIFKQAIKKILGLNNLDFGDIIFPWKNGAGQELDNRYYHAFSAGELRRLAIRTGFRKIILNKNKHNYWLILSS